MEKSSNIEDQAMDNLLRNYAKQQSQPSSICEGFDADLASLYLERVLTETESSRYEIHLFDCSPCRANVVALARFIEQEVPVAVAASLTEASTQKSFGDFAQSTSGTASQSWAERFRMLLGLFTTPGFALAAVAVLALAVGIPFIVSQKDNNAKNSATGTASISKTPNEAPSDVLVQAPSINSGSPTVPENAKEAAALANPSNSSSPASASNSQGSGESVATGSASGGLGVATPTVEAAAGTDKNEPPKSDATTPAENRPRAEEGAGRANETPAVAASQPAPASPEKKELGRIDSKDALRIPDSDKEAAAKTLKPGISDGNVARGNKPTGATIRPGDAEAPATSADASRRTGLAEKGKSLRDESDVRKEPRRAAASRKVHDKTFFLIDDVWTDKEYKKDKELPVVTVIKDSDVYKEVLEKRSGLQKFFTSFAANERVIIIYKGTVYKLIPQGGN
jgi:hypothetical protein